MTPDEHRADLATQHEDAAVEARGDIIRERTYWGGIEDEQIARIDLRMDLAQAGEWIW